MHQMPRDQRLLVKCCLTKRLQERSLTRVAAILKLLPGLPGKRLGYALESKNGRLASKKTRKKEKFPDIEQELLRFFQRYRSEGYLSKILLNGPILRERALNIARDLGHFSFLASNGWLERFRMRNEVSSIKIHGEGGSCPPHVLEQYRHTLKILTAGYQRNLIFNADETALFYRQLPNKGFVFKSEARSRQLRGYDEMSSKDRVTLHLCANADGSQTVPMLIIGKSKSPFSLRVTLSYYSLFILRRIVRFLIISITKIKPTHG